MPLTDEEEKTFRQLRRRKDREYAKQRRDKHRVRTYTPRKMKEE